MTFNPNDFYTLAVWLSGAKPDEGGFRTAIGRAYYAVHLLAVEKAKARGFEPKGTGDDHRGIINYLKTGRTSGLASRIISLRMLREHADYHLDFSQTIVLRQCDLCNKAQKASASAPTVTATDWQEAKTLSDSCLPLIEKL